MDITGWLSDTLNGILTAVLFLLPNSPFQNITMPPELKELLGYVNCYIPITEIRVMYTVWLSAILVYYAYRAILNWTKVD